MTNTSQTIKCHCCGKPYKFYMFSAADQSACPACVKLATQLADGPDTDEQFERRMKYFGLTHD